ncbi:MAG: cob(I)yrinic acid a,c-diamide adenosyltransferase [Alistipes sp.]|nr:cob(I)yrinic acid a,c-diamide adenosyltransferase [Alistipes sp.]
MKIYTKQGDGGMTSLIGGERIFKTDLRVEAYGTVDELSAFTAILADLLRKDTQAQVWVNELNRILSQMMTIEALLAVGEGAAEKVQPLAPEAIAWLEERIDTMQAAVKPLTKFTIPGGHPAVSACHICRTVCRRAERAALRADHEYGIDPSVKAWLNRLSDYFYLLGRVLTEHYHIDEVLWIP